MTLTKARENFPHSSLEQRPVLNLERVSIKEIWECVLEVLWVLATKSGSYITVVTTLGSSTFLSGALHTTA